MEEPPDEMSLGVNTSLAVNVKVTSSPAAANVGTVIEQYTLPRVGAVVSVVTSTSTNHSRTGYRAVTKGDTVITAPSLASAV